MPRTARLEELGLTLHVIVQGIDRCDIVRDDTDRRALLRRAARVFSEMGIEVVAWALMDNHLHLVLRSTSGRISKAMHRLLCGYAQEFNRRHDRVGPLFRDRFWSRPVKGDDDLSGLISYVLLNPARAGIVQTIDELAVHPWTSLSELVSPPTDRPRLVQPVRALMLFGPDNERALGALRRRLAERLEQDPDGLEHAQDEPGGRRSLRPSERVNLGVAATHALRLSTDQMAQALRDRATATALRIGLQSRGWTLAEVVRRAVLFSGADEVALRAGSRRGAESRARALVAKFAAEGLGCSDTAIARATGVTQQAISRARARGAQVAASRLLDRDSFFCGSP